MEWEPREKAAGLAAVVHKSRSVHSRAKQWIDMSLNTTIDAANNLERPIRVSWDPVGAVQALEITQAPLQMGFRATNQKIARHEVRTVCGSNLVGKKVSPQVQ